MKKEKFKQRMYGFVPYQLSGTVHAGIQFGHAVVEYQLKYGETEEYLNWAKKDKTFIILNGGTTNDKNGTLNSLKKELNLLDIKFATFREPDLNDALTGIVFLLDERVWDKEKYVYETYESITYFAPIDVVESTNLTKQELHFLKIREFISKFRLS